MYRREEGKPTEYSFRKVLCVTLCDTIMADTCHYTFVQTHRMHNTKSEP